MLRKRETKLKFLIKLKPSTSKFNTKNTVYKINCSNCECVYIHKEQFSQYLKSRTCNHRNYVEILKNSTALTKRSINTGHMFNFDNSTILNKGVNYFERSLKEILHIKMEKTVNFRSHDSLDNRYLQQCRLHCNQQIRNFW